MGHERFNEAVNAENSDFFDLINDSRLFFVVLMREITRLVEDLSVLNKDYYGDLKTKSEADGNTFEKV